MSFDLYKKKLLIALAEYDRWQKSLSNTGVFCTIRYWKYFSDDSKKRLKDWIPFVRSDPVLLIWSYLIWNIVWVLIIYNHIQNKAALFTIASKPLRWDIIVVRCHNQE